MVKYVRALHRFFHLRSRMIRNRNRIHNKSIMLSLLSTVLGSHAKATLNTLTSEDPLCSFNPPIASSQPDTDAVGTIYEDEVAAIHPSNSPSCLMAT